MGYGKSLDTQKKLLYTMSRLLRSQGYNGTGIAQITQESEIPKGSLYYHFPSGKEDLATAALTLSNEQMAATLKKIAGLVPGPLEAVELLCHFYMEELKGSNFQRGCPLATVTLETAATNDTLQQVCDAGYTTLIQLLASILRTSRLPYSETRDFATFALAAIEGALILCKAQRSTVPLQMVKNSLRQLLSEKLEKSGKKQKK